MPGDQPDPFDQVALAARLLEARARREQAIARKYAQGGEAPAAVEAGVRPKAVETVLEPVARVAVENETPSLPARRRYGLFAVAALVLAVGGVMAGPTLFSAETRQRIAMMIAPELAVETVPVGPVPDAMARVADLPPGPRTEVPGLSAGGTAPVPAAEAPVGAADVVAAVAQLGEIDAAVAEAPTAADWAAAGGPGALRPPDTALSARRVSVPGRFAPPLADAPPRLPIDAAASDLPGPVVGSGVPALPRDGGTGLARTVAFRDGRIEARLLVPPVDSGILREGPAADDAGAALSRVVVHYPPDGADLATAAMALIADASPAEVEGSTVNLAISQTNVRYYHPEDAQAADEILLALGQLGATDAVSRDFTDFRPQPLSGVIEVWIAGSPQPAAAVRRAPAPPSAARQAEQAAALRARDRALAEARVRSMLEVRIEELGRP